MGLRERGTRALAGQLGHPSGRFGRLVGRVLDRRNAPAVRAAVAAVPARPGAVLADIGFGGGLGLDLLLRRLDEADRDAAGSTASTSRRR